MRRRGNDHTHHFTGLRQDIVYAARSLRRQPAFTLFVTLALALGIGANSAIFGLLDRLLLSAPPHVRDAGRVVRLMVTEGGEGPRFTMSSTSYATFADLSHAVRSFESIAASAPGPLVFGRGRSAMSVHGAKVSGTYFELLGALPETGRFLVAEDDRPPAGLDVAVISYSFWQSQLGGDSGAVGRGIDLDGSRYSIVGIAPRGFTGDGVDPVDIWIPLSAGMRNMPAGWRENRGLNLVTVFARLRRDVTESAARQEATAAYRHGREGLDFARRSAGEIGFLPLIAAVGPSGITREGQITLWLGGVALAVFLIAVGNVTTLLLLRSARYQRETAVRLALGMNGGRLVRLWVTESLLLAGLGGAVGLVAAHWGASATRLALLPEMAPGEGLFGSRVLAMTVTATILAGLVAGLISARQTYTTALAHRVGTNAQRRIVRRSPLLTALLLLQTGLSAALLAGAGLFLVSLNHARTQNLGFTAKRILLAQLPQGEDGGAQDDAYYRDALQRVRMLPGVELAIPVDSLPFGAHTVPPIGVPGMASAPGESTQLPFMNAAAPGYFSLMGTTLLKGRVFDSRDGTGAPLVVVVSETMARTIWPGQDPIGRCIRIGYSPGESPSLQASASLPCRDVVGIVADARQRSIRPEAIPIMEYYVPFDQRPAPPFPGIPTISGLLIRPAAAADERVVERAVQQAMQSVSAADAVYVEVHPYQDLLEVQIRPWRLGSTLFSIFGGLAVALAGIGLYGVQSYLVAQRTKELGIRRALGARSTRLIAGVVAEALSIALIGLVFGALLVLAFGRLLEPLLFGVTSRDPWVLASVGLTLMAVASFASWGPALRATRVDPATALRAE